MNTEYKKSKENEKKDVSGRPFKTYCANCKHIIKASEYGGREHLCSIKGLTSYVGTYSEMQPCYSINTDGNCDMYDEKSLPEPKKGFLDMLDECIEKFIKWFKE